jgi:hypothetical protein
MWVHIPEYPQDFFLFGIVIIFIKLNTTAMRIKFNMDDTMHLNKRWIKNTILVFAFTYFIISFAHIFLIVFKPGGYEKIVFVLGDRYLVQMFMGLLFLSCYFVIKYSKPVDSK